jgi:hypothetical protein
MLGYFFSTVDESFFHLGFIQIFGIVIEDLLFHFHSFFQAAFMVVQQSDSPNEIALLIDLLLHVQHPDKYQTPTLILSITGGAQDFDLPVGLLHELRKGIVQVRSVFFFCFPFFCI